MSPNEDLDEQPLDNWLMETDEQQQAVEDLRLFTELLTRIASDRFYWRWALMVLHHAHQSFMVCALRGSDGLAPLTAKSAEKELAFIRAGHKGQPPALRLANYSELFEKSQGSLMERTTIGRRYTPDEDHRDSVIALGAWRDKFMHYQPQGWLVPVIEFPEISLHVLDAIAYLVDESGTIHFDEEANVLMYRQYLQSAQQLCRELYKRYVEQMNAEEPEIDA